MVKHFGGASLNFNENLPDGTGTAAGGNSACSVTPVGKRRDGGTRYWCTTHKADATAKYGRPAAVCSAPNRTLADASEIASLDLMAYPGGVALWGAVPPVYDTTDFPMERGIHIHARTAPGEKKALDRSFETLRVIGPRLPEAGVVVSEIDAIYFMVTAVLGHKVKRVECSYCGMSHLDKDYFSVRPHRRHLCAGCGKHFQDSSKGIGNPIRSLQEACGVEVQAPVHPDRPLDIRQEDFPGGIQIWGTNSAILWTGETPEEEGIHVHGLDAQGKHVFDETYSTVRIDGINLDPTMVRTLMAQKALPSLAGRILTITCEACAAAQFDTGEAAYTPTAVRSCTSCGASLTTKSRFRNVVSNPLVDQLRQLAEFAPRIPQEHELGLVPESL